MRWVLGGIGAVVVLLLTFPVLASGSSDGPGTCSSVLGFRTLGDSASCDTVGTAVSLPTATAVFLLVAWGWMTLEVCSRPAGVSTALDRRLRRAGARSRKQPAPRSASPAR